MPTRPIHICCWTLACLLTFGPPVEAQRTLGGTWIEGTNLRTWTDANPRAVVTARGRRQFGWYCDDLGVIRALVKGVAPAGDASVELEYSTFQMRSRDVEGPVTAFWSSAPEIPELWMLGAGWRMLGAEESQALRETLSRAIENSEERGRSRRVVLVAVTDGDGMREQFSLEDPETAIRFLNCSAGTR